MYSLLIAYIFLSYFALVTNSHDRFLAKLRNNNSKNSGMQTAFPASTQQFYPSSGGWRESSRSSISDNPYQFSGSGSSFKRENDFEQDLLNEIRRNQFISRYIEGKSREDIRIDIEDQGKLSGFEKNNVVQAVNKTIFQEKPLGHLLGENLEKVEKTIGKKRESSTCLEKDKKGYNTRCEPKRYSEGDNSWNGEGLLDLEKLVTEKLSSFEEMRVINEVIEENKKNVGLLAIPQKIMNRLFSSNPRTNQLSNPFIAPPISPLPESNFLYSLFQYEIVQDNWWVKVGTSPSSRMSSLVVGNDIGFGAGQLGKQDGVVSFNIGWRDMVLQALSNTLNEEILLGFAKNRKGFFIDFSRKSKAVAIEALGSFVEIGTLVDFKERLYGGRVRVRNFDIGLTHHFRHEYIPENSNYATQIMLGYGPIAFIGGIDIVNSHYGAGVGFGGTSLKVNRDFDDRITQVVAQFGRAWELSLETNLVDSHSKELYARVGFGRLARKFFLIGAGISEDGLPLIHTQFQLPSSLVQMQLSSRNKNYIFEYSISVGKHTQAWKLTLIPSHLRIPNLFGMNPSQIQKILRRITK